MAAGTGEMGEIQKGLNKILWFAIKYGKSKLTVVSGRHLKTQMKSRDHSKLFFLEYSRQKGAAPRPEMFFSSCQKDKTSCIWARNVFLKLPKGQNTLHLGSECPFEAAKRTKRVASGIGMSF
jgi:GMP synthase-like glutamine amidotransferase